MKWLFLQVRERNQPRKPVLKRINCIREQFRKGAIDKATARSKGAPKKQQDSVEALRSKRKKPKPRSPQRLRHPTSF
jgi:hypothetical protein